MKNFIPKPEKKGNVTIRLDFDIMEQIDKISGQYDLSRSAFIVQCIKFALANMPPPENAPGGEEE